MACFDYCRALHFHFRLKQSRDWSKVKLGEKRVATFLFFYFSMVFYKFARYEYEEPVGGRSDIVASAMIPIRL